MKTTFAIGFQTLILFCVASTVDAQNAPSITIDDLLALKQLSSPTAHPDGHWIAYEVEHNDIEADEKVTRIFMTSRDGRETLAMTSADHSAGSPKFSPDGRFLAFLAARGDDEAVPQVWTLDLRGGDAQVYSAVSQGVQGFAWAPDSRRMALVVKDKSDAELAADAAKEAGEEPKPLPYVIDRLQFKQDGVPYLDRSRSHLYLIEEREAEAIQLTFGDFDDGQPTWRPDGRALAFVSNRTEEPDANSNTDIWLVGVPDAGSPPPAPRQLTTNSGSDYSPAWSHDGRKIAYVTVTEPDLIWYATNHLAIVDATGGDERVLTAALDRNVGAPKFAVDDEAIVFLLEDSAEQHLARIALDDYELVRLLDGEVSVRDFALDEAGGVALLISTPSAPAEAFTLRDGQLSKISEHNLWLDERALGEVINVTFPSSDGTTIEGFVFTPPDYQRGRRYPTILRIHGGPVSQYDFGFNAEARLLAAKGYVVVIANPRGSSGYGQAFSAALFAEWGVKDFEDVMAAVDFAIREGYSDADRLGVGGWSYGGILTNYVITKSDRFEGAITGASEVNYLANYGHDHYQRAWEAELGLPWENREAWERISPWNDVDNIVTPTLVMGGKEDWNVPIQNSEQLYQALRRRGVDTQLVVYPDESHGLSRPSFIHDRYQRYIDWYDTHVRGR